jgi:hypothetical protein
MVLFPNSSARFSGRPRAQFVFRGPGLWWWVRWFGVRSFWVGWWVRVRVFGRVGRVRVRVGGRGWVVWVVVGLLWWVFVFWLLVSSS